MRKTIRLTCFMAIFILGILCLSEIYLDAYCPSGGGGGRTVRPPSGGNNPPPVVAGPTRPPSGTGLEPLVFNPPNPNPSLFSAWEIWWIRNRLNYLPFKTPIVWEEKKQTGEGTVAQARIPHKDIIDGIANALKNDKNPYVRAMAALAFGKFKNRNSIPHLKEAAGDKDFDVKNVVCLALGMFGKTDYLEDIKSILFSDKARDISRAYAALALGYIKDEASIEALKEVFNTKKRVEKDVACAALLALGNIQDASVIPFLEKILFNNRYDTQVRAYAALGLGRIRDEKAVTSLKRALKEKNTDIRASAVIALGLIKSPKTKQDLINIFQKDKDLRIQQFAAISLAKLDDKSVYDTLFQAITSKKINYNLKSFAVIGLGILDHPMAADRIREMVIKKEMFVRQAAILGVGLLKDKKSVPVLIKIIEKEQYSDPVSFLYAIQALGLIGDKTALPVLEKLYKKCQKDVNIATAVYNNLTVALSMLGKRTEILDTLYKRLKDKSAPALIKTRALHGIAYVGDKSSIKPLLDFYKAETKNQDLRNYAMFALGFVLDPEKVNPLYEITADNNYYIWLNIMNHINASKPD